MPNKEGRYLYNGSDDTSPGPAVYLDPGIYLVEVMNDVTGATVQVQTTLHPGADDWKDEADMALDANTKANVMRGGRYVRVTVTGSPQETIDVLFNKSSS